MATSAERVKDIRNYIVQGVLWQAFTAEQPVALLIDEIDKADIEFPNDLLREARPHGVLLLRDARDSSGQAPAAGVHHLNNEKSCRRLLAPLLLPLHQVPRSRDDEADRRRALPHAQEPAAHRR